MSDAEPNTPQNMKQAYKFVYDIFRQKLKTLMSQYGQQRIAKVTLKLLFYPIISVALIQPIVLSSSRESLQFHSFRMLKN